MSYQSQVFPLPVESLNLDAVAKATKTQPTEAELDRARQRERAKLPEELERIDDLIEFHSDRAERYEADRSNITAKIATLRAAIKELEPMAASRGSIRDRIAQLEEEIASLHQHELRVAGLELEKHARLLAVNKQLREEFPHEELKAFLKEQAVLAKAGL